MKSNRNWNLEFNFLCLWLYKDMKPLISCSCSSSRSVIFLPSLYSPLTVLLEDNNTRRDQQQHNKASALFTWCDNNIKHQKYWGRHNDVLPYIIRRSEIHFFQHLNKASPDFCVQVAMPDSKVVKSVTAKAWKKSEVFSENVGTFNFIAET